MDKVKIGQETAELERSIRVLNKAINEHFTPLLEEYKQFDLMEITNDLLIEFFTTPRSFFVKALTKNQPIQIGDLTLNPTKVYDILLRPAGVDQLVDKLEKFAKSNANFEHKNAYASLQYFEFVEGELQIKESYLTELDERYSYYAETEKQVSAWELLNSILDNIQQLNELLSSERIEFDTDNSSLLTLKGDKTYSVNYQRLLRETK